MTSRRVRRLTVRYARLTRPRPDGLPNLLVLTWFPALVLLGTAVLVLLEISGTSTGAWAVLLGQRHDPHLIAGTPRLIRADEWQVQTSWVVSQDTLGHPRTNPVMPGGLDATVFNDLPTWDWSTLFRPHLWGLLVLGLGRGAAWRWWVPADLMVVASYLFVVTLRPRRAGLGALLALTLLFQPLVQWIWLPIVPQPVAFAFAAMAAAVWGLRGGTRMARVLPAVAAAYLACDMVMSVYLPFMVPAALATVAVVLGLVLHERRRRALSVRQVVTGLLPLGAAAAATLAVVGVWVLTRRAAVHALLSTVYPGQRHTAPGELARWSELTAFAAAPFERSLQSGVYAGLGPQQSDAGNPFLVSVFLVVPMVALLVLTWRSRRQVDWPLAAVVAVQLLVLAFMFVPGWGSVSPLFGLDRTLPLRAKLLFVILLVVAVVLLVDRLDRLHTGVSWPVTGATVLLVLAASAAVWAELRHEGSPVVPSVWPVLLTLALAAAVGLVLRRHATAGSALLLAAALVVAAGVNPVYRGVYDLRRTSMGEAVAKVHRDDPQGHWVALGATGSTVRDLERSLRPDATLVETAVPAYAGVQTYPSPLMWSQIDPSHRYEQVWNRLAHISWVAGTGNPLPRLTAEDHILLTFDSCAPFAQAHVDFVLAEGVHGVDQRCLKTVSAGRDHGYRFRIYRVVHAYINP